MSSEFIPPSEKVEIIPEDLKNQWQACEATATAFNVLDKGYFPHSYHKSVKASLGFLSKLHEKTVEGALNHPQAFMIPELKTELDKRNNTPAKKTGASNEETAEH